MRERCRRIREHGCRREDAPPSGRRRVGGWRLGLSGPMAGCVIEGGDCATSRSVGPL